MKKDDPLSKSNQERSSLEYDTQMISRVISVIIPCHNEEKNIIKSLHALNNILDNIPHITWKVLLIDDGSSDKTLEIATSLQEQDNRLKIIEFSRNFGKEAAMTAGLDEATGDAAIIIDADLQDDPSLIPQMVKKWEEGTEVVLAKRSDRTTDHVLKRFTASLFYRTHNALSPLKIPENVGDFRLIDRCVIDALKLLPERQRFMKGLFAYVGFKTETLTYKRQARETGESKFTPLSLWNLALEGFTSFSTIPLRIWTYLGTIGAILSIIYGFFVVFHKLLYGNGTQGYTSIFFAILFFGSIQMITVGILGEYIGRIYMETKQRPVYIIRKRH
ncbi:glycosyltransferase family 2 protein [Bombella sp. ESL0378]|uniref:glycosyltransferase family 2 protein n=1 Tax=Bombella sp. ESL0378 TaxID=2676442 RepID=UPI001E364889|nr:glycosyltransferase family 2 protein [Bombella sp. ESL0378]